MTDHKARVLPFNDRSIAAAPYYGSGREAEYRIEGNPGLILAVIRPNRKGQSRRTWRVQYSLMKDGRQVKRKLWLGRYPAVCLADARAEASKIMLAVDRGADPIAQAEATKADDDRNALTFRDLAEEYVADQRQAGVARTSEIERALRRDAFPTLADKRPSEITDVDIEKVVDAVAARGSRSMARHLLTYLRGMFNHALRGSPQLSHKYGLVFNPTDTVGRGRRGRPGKYGRPVPRDRVLNDGEIVAFWHAVEASQMVPGTKVIFKLLLLTGQRLGEVRKTNIDELRLEGHPYWDLPGGRTKNRIAHIVPLSSSAAKLFREALHMTRAEKVAHPEDLQANRSPTQAPAQQALFPSADTTDGFLGDYTARQALQRLFESGRLTCPRFTAHDLRRTLETGLARLGVVREIRDRVLNHKPQGVGDQHYNRHDYAAEKRAALALWAKHVEGLIRKHSKMSSAARRNSAQAAHSKLKQTEIPKFLPQ